MGDRALKKKKSDLHPDRGRENTSPGRKSGGCWFSNLPREHKVGKEFCLRKGNVLPADGRGGPYLLWNYIKSQSRRRNEELKEKRRKLGGSVGMLWGRFWCIIRGGACCTCPFKMGRSIWLRKRLKEPIITESLSQPKERTKQS